MLMTAVPLKGRPSVSTPLSASWLSPLGSAVKPWRGNLMESDTLSTDMGPDRSGATPPRRSEPGTIRSADHPWGTIRAEIHCPWLPELRLDGVSVTVATSESPGGGGGGRESTVAHCEYVDALGWPDASMPLATTRQFASDPTAASASGSGRLASARHTPSDPALYTRSLRWKELSIPPTTHTRPSSGPAAGYHRASGRRGAELQEPACGSKRSTAAEGATSVPPITQKRRSSTAPATPLRGVGSGAIGVHALATGSKRKASAMGMPSSPWPPATYSESPTAPAANAARGGGIAATPDHVPGAGPHRSTLTGGSRKARQTPERNTRT